MSRKNVSPSKLFQQLQRGETTNFAEDAPKQKIEETPVATVSDTIVDKNEQVDVQKTAIRSNSDVIKENIENTEVKLPNRKTEKLSGKAKGNERYKLTVYFEDDELDKFEDAFLEIQKELRKRSRYKLVEYKFIKIATMLAIEQGLKNKDKFIKQILEKITEG
ncbi:MAG TPA: hypothetical protein PKY82_07365 [Pyrinomonadaceae bacterium]|nr:hypothetical protein [Pyrinomonadaceae bacterium]